MRLEVGINATTELDLNTIISVISKHTELYQLMDYAQNETTINFTTNSSKTLAKVLLENKLVTELTAVKDVIIMHLLQTKKIYIKGIPLVVIDKDPDGDFVVLRVWRKRYILLTGFGDANHIYLNHEGVHIKLNTAIAVVEDTGLRTVARDIHTMYKDIKKDHHKIATQLTL